MRLYAPLAHSWNACTLPGILNPNIEVAFPATTGPGASMPPGEFATTAFAQQWKSGLSRHMHDTDKSGVALKLVWLERGHPRASTVADVLSAAGFPEIPRAPARYGLLLYSVPLEPADEVPERGTS